VHILTKILVVLVALLVVVLVPVTAVLTVNQVGFQERASTAEAAAKAEQASLNAAKDSYHASVTGLQSKVAGLEKTAALASQARDSEIASKNKAEADKQALEMQISSLEGERVVYGQNDSAKVALIQAMQAELQKTREMYLAAEKSRVDLEDRLVRAEGERDTADAARRQLQEQFQKASEEKDRASAELARFAAQQGTPSATRAGATADAARLPVVADRSLSATVVSVKREPDSTLAEINAGSRDGVKEGWVMTLADGSNFIGNLRIVTVDVNRAVGVVELEDPQGRGEVKSGQRAIARKGE
jgi:hypothetical protein